MEIEDRRARNRLVRSGRPLLGGVALLAWTSCGAGEAEPAGATRQARPPVATSAVEHRVPWSAVEPRLREKLVGAGFDAWGRVERYCGWDASGRYRPDYSGSRLNPRRREIDAEGRAELDAIADSYDSEILPLAEAAVDQLHRAMIQLWDEGDFLRRPRDPVDAPTEADLARAAEERIDPLRSRGVYAAVESFVLGGWEVSLLVDAGLRPSLQQAILDLRDANRRRDLALHEHIRNR